MTQFFSYLRASLRLWRKQWVGVFVAVAGLAAAFAVSILTAFYVYDGLMSDIWLEDADRLYRVNTQSLTLDGKQAFGLQATSDERVAAEAMKQFASIEATTRLKEKYVQLVRGEDLVGKTWVEADATFTDIFKLPMVAGDLAAVFADPNSVALSESEAEAFGGTTAIGSVIEVKTGTQSYEDGKEKYSYGDKIEGFKLVAIYEDLPPNTHLVIPGITLYRQQPESDSFTFGGDFYTYFKVAKGHDPAPILSGFQDAVSHVVPQIKNFHMKFEVTAERVLGLQFRTKTSGAFKPPVQKQYLYVLVIMSGVLLLSAGFNFANVFTAINLMRGREMAVRSIVGASRFSLGSACLLEGLAVASLASIFAVLLARDLAPLVTELTKIEMVFWGIGRLWLWLRLLVAVFLVGVLSSLYPTLVMARVKPGTLLRDAQASVMGGKGRLKQFLVALQAVAFVSTALAAAQIFGQVDHLVNRDRGYRVKDSMVVKAPSDSEQAASFASSFHQAVSQLEGVHKTAISRGRLLASLVYIFHVKNDREGGTTRTVAVDISHDVFDVMGVTYKASLAENFSDFAYPIAISERDLAAYGFSAPEAAIGKTLQLVKYNNSGIDMSNPVDMTVVAVVPRFRGENKYFGGAPYLYRVKPVEPEKVGYITLHADLSRYEQLYNNIERLWVERFPGETLYINRYDEAVEQRYENQMRIGRAVLWVALVTAVLGFAGLYGLATHWLTAREREIALRRVLGASRGSVTGFAMRRLLVPVFAGAVLALVPTWLAMAEWLQTFNDQAPLGIYLYGLAVVATVAFAGILLLMLVMRALTKRPARVLYHE
jgi:putative ABC transport system permease protein